MAKIGSTAGIDPGRDLGRDREIERLEWSTSQASQTCQPPKLHGPDRSARAMPLGETTSMPPDLDPSEPEKRKTFLLLPGLLLHEAHHPKPARPIFCNLLRMHLLLYCEAAS